MGCAVTFIRHAPLRPGDWRGEWHLERGWAPFEATWTATLDVLDRELRQLRALDVVLQVAVGERGVRLDGSLRADAKAEHPGVILSFRSKHGPLRYQCDRFERGFRGAKEGWQCNVRAIALGLEALRKVDRYGIVQSGEQYRGFAELPAARPMPAAMTVDEAERILREWWSGAVSECNDWECLYRRGAKNLHPDVGGDTEAFRRLTNARDLLNEMSTR